MLPQTLSETLCQVAAHYWSMEHFTSTYKCVVLWFVGLLIACSTSPWLGGFLGLRLVDLMLYGFRNGRDSLGLSTIIALSDFWRFEAPIKIAIASATSHARLFRSRYKQEICWSGPWYEESINNTVDLACGAYQPDRFALFQECTQGQLVLKGWVRFARV